MTKKTDLDYWLEKVMRNEPVDDTNYWVKQIRQAQREIRAEQRKFKAIRKQEEELEKQAKKLREEEAQKHQDTLNYQKLKSQLEYYNKIIFEQENTIDYIDHDCTITGCDCKTARVILRPDTRHYAEIKCNLCHGHQKWLPYPRGVQQ